MKKNLRNGLRSYLSLALTMALMASCQNDEEEWISPIDDLLVDGSCSVYTIPNPEQKAWKITDLPKWATYVKQSGTAADPIEVYVESNSRGHREGSVQISFEDKASRSVMVRQTDIKPEHDVNRARAVGWGFDVRTYNDSRGLKDQILNTQKVRNYDEEAIFEDRNVDSYVQVAYGTDFHSLGENINANMKLGITGGPFNLSLQGAFGKNTTKDSKRVFSWMRGIYQEWTVDMNDLDLYDAQGFEAEETLLTVDFEEERKKVIEAGGSDESIRELIDRYGTHYVRVAVLGGYLDYYYSSVVEDVSDSKTIKGAIALGYSQKFGLDGNVDYQDELEQMSEESTETFLVKGGDALMLTNKVVAGKMDNDALQEWLKSMKATSPTDRQLELINFTLEPISAFFTTEAEIALKIEKYIKRTMYYDNLPLTRSYENQ